MIKTGKEYLLTQFEDVKSLSIIGIAQAMEQYAIYYHESQLKNHGGIQNVSEILLWIVKNSQHQVWSILRSEEEAKEILAHHQKDHPDEYFYIERKEV